MEKNQLIKNCLSGSNINNMMQDEITEQVKEQVKEVIPKNVWDILNDFFSYEIFHFGTDEHPFVLTVGLLFFAVLIFVFTSLHC